MGNGALDGVRLLRARLPRLHGEVLVRAEAVPSRGDAHLRRERHSFAVDGDRCRPSNQRRASRHDRLARMRDFRGRRSGREDARLPLCPRFGFKSGPPAPVDHRPRGARGVQKARREARRDHRLRRRRLESRRTHRAVHGREAARRGGLPHRRRRARELPVVHARQVRLRLLRHGTHLPACEDVHARRRLHPVAEPRRRPSLPWHELDSLRALRPEAHGGGEREADRRVRGRPAVRARRGNSPRARVEPRDSRRDRRGAQVQGRGQGGDDPLRAHRHRLLRHEGEVADI